MAVRYYGVDVGATNEISVAEDSSSNSTTFEFTVNLAVTTTQLDALLALEAIENYIVSQQTWPPA